MGILLIFYINLIKQECIPVGCVPPAAVAITGGLHPPQSITPWSRHPQADTPEQRPPLARSPSTSPLAVGLDHIPLNFPPGFGPGDPPQSDPPKLPPWVWAWKPARHAGIPPPGHLLQGMLGYHPSVDRHTPVKT